MELTREQIVKRLGELVQQHDKYYRELQKIISEREDLLEALREGDYAKDTNKEKKQMSLL